MHFRMPSGELLEAEIVLFFLNLFFIVLFLSMFSEPPEKEKYRARLTIRDPKNRFERFIVNRRRGASYGREYRLIADEYYHFGCLCAVIWIVCFFACFHLIIFPEKVSAAFFLMMTTIVFPVVVDIVKVPVIHVVLKLADKVLHVTYAEKPEKEPYHPDAEKKPLKRTRYTEQKPKKRKPHKTRQGRG